MSKTDLETEVTAAAEEVKDILQFGRELWGRSKGIKPMMHQIVRIYQAVRNGNRRLLCADTTSAGKTLTAIAIKGMLDHDYQRRLGRNARLLVIAPNQAIPTAWSSSEVDSYTKALGLPSQRRVVMGRGTLDELHRNDLILVNYDKLSMTEPGSSNVYTRTLHEILSGIDMVVVDECHNLKNLATNRVGAFRDVVEKTKDCTFVMLSASPIPNRLSDAGFLLYMLDPIRFKHYATERFDYTQDPFSIMNAMSSGNWFSMTRDDIKHLLKLPSLNEQQPYRFQMTDADAARYFDIWKDQTLGVSKVSKLSRVLLESEFVELETMVDDVRRREPTGQVAVFSFYKKGFSNELAARLERIAGPVGIITGDEPMAERLRVAKEFREGSIRTLVNTISTVSESVSLCTRERPCQVIFAEPPCVPANYTQAVGRFYRLGLVAPVGVVEVIPCSDTLNALMMDDQRRQKEEGVRFRESWRPGTVFEDKYHQRNEKMTEIDRVQRGLTVSESMDVSSEKGIDPRIYVTLPTPAAPAAPNKTFNEGLKRVRTFIGRGLEHLTGSDEKRYLIESYGMDGWDITTSADTNRAIALTLDAIEKGAGRKMERILDWGCGPACLARISGRRIYNLDALQEMLDVGKERCAGLNIYEDPATHFILGDAKAMPFDKGFFDVVSSSYALQYNAQGFQHRRDVERILLETNRVLVPDGYGIFGLPNQATTGADMDALTQTLLPRYGFRVLMASTVKGTGENNAFASEFKLVLYQKHTAQTEMVGPDVTFVHSPYKLVGIGGVRERGCAPHTTKAPPEKVQASVFTADNQNLTNTITEAVRRNYDN